MPDKQRILSRAANVGVLQSSIHLLLNKQAVDLHFLIQLFYKKTNTNENYGMKY